MCLLLISDHCVLAEHGWDSATACLGTCICLSIQLQDWIIWATNKNTQYVQIRRIRPNSQWQDTGCPLCSCVGIGFFQGKQFHGELLNPGPPMPSYGMGIKEMLPQGKPQQLIQTAGNEINSYFYLTSTLDVTWHHYCHNETTNAVRFYCNKNLRLENDQRQNGYLFSLKVWEYGAGFWLHHIVVS